MSLPILGSDDRAERSSALLFELEMGAPTLLYPWAGLRISRLVRSVFGGAAACLVRLVDLALGIRALLVERDRPDLPEFATILGDVTGGRSLDLIFVSTRVVV